MFIDDFLHFITKQLGVLPLDGRLICVTLVLLIKGRGLISPCSCISKRSDNSMCTQVLVFIICDVKSQIEPHNCPYPYLFQDHSCNKFSRNPSNNVVLKENIKDLLIGTQNYESTCTTPRAKTCKSIAYM